MLSMPGLVAMKTAVQIEESRVGVNTSPAWHVTLNVLRALAPGVVSFACVARRV